MVEGERKGRGEGERGGERKRERGRGPLLVVLKEERY